MTTDEQYDKEVADPMFSKIRWVEREYIICAANWYQDGKLHEHQARNIKTGFVVTGRRHHNCFMTYSIIRSIQLEDQPRINIEQGFLTSKDRWLNREDAAKLAFESGQITRETKQLFSEDIY